MQALIYLKKRTFINSIKKAVRTPKAYIFFVLVILYGVMMTNFFVELAQGIDDIGPRNFVGLITILIFMTWPTSIISYIKKRGIVFKKADVNLAFSTPLSPKMNLIFSKMNSFLVGTIIGIAFGVIAIFVFHTPILETVVYSIFLAFIEPIFEGALVILIYGNEVLSEKAMTLIKVLMYVIIAGLAIGIASSLVMNGLSWKSVNDLLFSPWVLGIPVVGWSISLAHLLFLEPSIYAIIFSLCYAVCFVVALIAALKMKCTGAYYEDAMKFADDYAEARSRGKKGEVVQIGKKKKYKKANIKYKGTYAKAIFYRQILEYKKNRFFMFGGRTLIILLASIGGAVIFSFTEIRTEIGDYGIFIIPGIMMYIDLIFSGYITKWGKEMTYANLFLIPDTAFHKLWYATLAEHIRAAVDSLILVVPTAIVLRLSIIDIILMLIGCVLIQALKLYIRVFVHGIFRDSIGVMGKQLFHFLFYGIILAIAIIPTVFATIGLGVHIGFLLFIGIMVAVTLICMFVASEFFEKMEAVG